MKNSSYFFMKNYKVNKNSAPPKGNQRKIYPHFFFKSSAHCDGKGDEGFVFGILGQTVSFFDYGGRSGGAFVPGPCEGGGTAGDEDGRAERRFCAEYSARVMPGVLPMP